MNTHEIACRLRIRNLVKSRGDQRRRINIQVPHLDVDAGSFIAIVGQNGCGKSTLLDILALILAPDHVDEFYLLDMAHRLDRLNRREKARIRRQHFAYVLQTGGLLEFLSLRQNIRLAAQLTQQPLDRIPSIAAKLGIDDVLDQYPARVSGGQRQKATIACALIQSPDIILADEPTTALDAASAERLMHTFSQLTKEFGSSLIMVTHDHQLIQDSADHIYRFHLSEQTASQATSTLELEST